MSKEIGNSPVTLGVWASCAPGSRGAAIKAVFHSASINLIFSFPATCPTDKKLL